MVDERTLKMKEEYVKLFNEGLSPKQIAKIFGLSSWTVYHYLGEIAEEAGVPRDSLLKKGRSLNIDVPLLEYPPDLEGFRRHHLETMKIVTKVRDEMTKCEKSLDSFQKEEK